MLEEVAEEFDGEDPLRPKLREMLEATSGSIKELAADPPTVECFELPEPSEEDVESLRRLVLRREPDANPRLLSW